MTVIAVGSAKASPGATTLCLVLAATWPTANGAHVVIEADPDGGSLAARLRLGYEPGLVSLAAAARRGLDAQLLVAHAQMLGPETSVICGPASPHQAHAALGSVGERLGERLARMPDIVALVDVGRVGPGSPALPLARQATLCLLVVRPRLDEVHHLAPRLRALEQAGCRLGLVCVGAKPLSPLEVADSVGVELVGVVADDKKGAGLLCGQPGDDRVLRRSMLWRTAGDLASAIALRAAEDRPVPFAESALVDVEPEAVG